MDATKQYRGFRIPAGATIMINTWGMSHDPEVYERPKDFWPDRWMFPKAGISSSVGGTDIRKHTWFGSGRRFCPGVHLANNSLVRYSFDVVSGHLQSHKDDQHHEPALGVRFQTRS
jgi:cytochrome P450